MDDSVRVESVEHAKIVPWTNRAARERVSLKDARNTTWYWVATRGCAGLMVLKGKARIKGVFVMKEYRGAGVGTALADRLEAEAAKLDGIKEIEVYAHNPAFYEARGYSVVGKNQFGVALLRKEISRPGVDPCSSATEQSQPTDTGRARRARPSAKAPAAVLASSMS